MQRCWHFWRRKQTFYWKPGHYRYGCKPCRIKWLHERRTKVKR